MRSLSAYGPVISIVSNLLAYVTYNFIEVWRNSLQFIGVSYRLYKIIRHGNKLNIKADRTMSKKSRETITQIYIVSLNSSGSKIWYENVLEILISNMCFVCSYELITSNFIPFFAEMRGET